MNIETGRGRELFRAAERKTSIPLGIIILLLGFAAPPLHAKRVVCIDQPGDRYIHEYEGYERARATQDGMAANFVLGGKLEDCLALLQDGDELVIIAHGWSNCAAQSSGFKYGGQAFEEFGQEPGEVPVPAGFESLRDIEVTFGACHSALDPDGAGPKVSVIDRLLGAMGGKGRHREAKGFVNRAEVNVHYDVRYPNNKAGVANAAIAKAALMNNVAWRHEPPVNRPQAASNQQTAAQALVDSKLGAGRVLIIIPNRIAGPNSNGYAEPREEDLPQELTRQADAAAVCTVEQNCGLEGVNSPPICGNTGLSTGPPTVLEITTQDLEGGLCRIHVLKAVNADVNIPPFLSGTTDRVIVTATKLKESERSVVELEVTDCTGKIKLCDPVLSLVIRQAGKPLVETIWGIPQAEGKVTVYNGNPGLKNLLLTVNGLKFRVTGLGNGEEKTIDVSSAMMAGDRNIITLTAHGAPGARATVLIHD